MSELSALSSVRLAAEAAIEQALSPTIAILLAGRDLSGNPLALWSSPVVIVGSDDLEKITDEAVVACQATRS